MDVFCIIEQAVRLSVPTRKTQLQTPLAYDNSLAHAMRAKVSNEDGTDADLTGVGVTASALLADGTTVFPINGTASGNVAEVILPASCYLVPGRIKITMNLSSDGQVRTVLWVEGYVERNTSEDIVDPGTPVGNITTVINNANAAASAASAAASNANTAAQTATQTIAEAAKLGMTGVTTIQTGDDLNTYTTPGVYTASDAVAASLDNCPTARHFRMFVTYGSTATNVIQILIQRAGNTIYTRTAGTPNFTWAEWRRIIGTDEVKMLTETTTPSGRPNLLTGVTWTEGRKIGANGLEDETADTSYHYSDMIRVLPEKRYNVAVAMPNGASVKALYIDGYNSEGVWVKRLRIIPANSQSVVTATIENFFTESCVNIRISAASAAYLFMNEPDEQEEADLQSLYTMYTSTEWQAGRLNWETGETYAESGRIRMKDHRDLASADIIRAENLKVALFVYDKAKTYLGGWTGKKLSKSDSEAALFSTLNLREVREKYPDCIYRLYALRPGGSAAVEDAGLIRFYTQIIPYSSIGLYQKWAVIGSSSDAGYHKLPNDGPTIQDDLRHAWPNILARDVGNEVANYAYAGRTAQSFISATGSRSLAQLIADADAGEAAELYVICLGGNDENDHKNDSAEAFAAWLGTTANLHDGDSANTFFGYFGKVVDTIQTKAPTARIVITSTPGVTTYRATRAAMNAALREIAETYGVPFIDWHSDPFMESNVLVEDGYAGNHPTLPMYAGKAAAFDRLFSKTVREYPGYFADGPTSYTYKTPLEKLQDAVDEVVNNVATVAETLSYLNIN